MDIFFVAAALAFVIVAFIGWQFNRPLYVAPAALFALAIIIASAVSIVPTGKVGVVRVFGVVQQQTLEEGFNWVKPWAIVTKLEARGFQLVQSGERALEVVTLKGLRFSIDLSVPFKLNPLAAAAIESRIRNGNWIEEVTSIARETIRRVVVGYGTFEGFAERRASMGAYQGKGDFGLELSQAIAARIGEVFRDTYGIALADPIHVGPVLIRDVNPPAAITAAAGDLEAVRVERQTEEARLEVEKVRLQRRELEGSGYNKLFAQLPQGLDPRTAAQYLSAIADKTRADAMAYRLRTVGDAMAAQISRGGVPITVIEGSGGVTPQPVLPLGGAH